MTLCLAVRPLFVCLCVQYYHMCLLYYVSVCLSDMECHRMSVCLSVYVSVYYLFASG